MHATRRRLSVTRVAAIDCGTNAIRLLVADVDLDAGTLVDLDRRMEVVRLGESLERLGVEGHVVDERAIEIEDDGAGAERGEISHRSGNG
mgnify:CR=1 FL=1